MFIFLYVQPTSQFENKFAKFRHQKKKFEKILNIFQIFFKIFKYF